jgi:hypothetical protein
MQQGQGREHPWNIRRISHRHLHDQRNLMDLQLLTQAWAPEGAPVTSPFDHEPSLEDDTWPEDVLTRLETEIRRLQLRTLGERFRESGPLAERSYQAGQEAASKRWMQSDPSEGSIAPADKRALLLALFHSPLGGRLGPHAFLLRRSLVTEVSVELLQCPHRLASPQSAPETIDELCRQQFNWLRGYFGFLNPALTPAYSRPHGRCVVSW